MSKTFCFTVELFSASQIPDCNLPESRTASVNMSVFGAEKLTQTFRLLTPTVIFTGGGVKKCEIWSRFYDPNRLLGALISKPRKLREVQNADWRAYD